MIRVRLIAIFLVLKAIIKKILKILSVPFLTIWYVISWLSVILVAPFVLLGALIWSIIKGDWKL